MPIPVRSVVGAADGDLTTELHYIAVDWTANLADLYWADHSFARLNSYRCRMICTLAAHLADKNFAIQLQIVHEKYPRFARKPTAAGKIPPRLADKVILVRAIQQYRSRG